MIEQQTPKKRLILKIIGGSSLLIIFFFIILVVGALMILNFFGVEMSEELINDNFDYAEEYKKSLNNNLKDGYVPLSRILYFHLENDSLSYDKIYELNIDKKSKKLKTIDEACTERKLKNMGACTRSNLNENRIMLDTTVQKFNFPLATQNYTVTSFFNEQRIVNDKHDVHNGWDFEADAQTPVYSVCNGRITDVTFTQEANIPYNQSRNAIGNKITIECYDYGRLYYVIFAHLYPGSAKVQLGDTVSHWTEIASVGTTGESTGNHLHYQMYDPDRKNLDGMSFIDMSYSKP